MTGKGVEERDFGLFETQSCSSAAVREQVNFLGTDISKPSRFRSHRKQRTDVEHTSIMERRHVQVLVEFPLEKRVRSDDAIIGSLICTTRLVLTISSC